MYCLLEWCLILVSITCRNISSAIFSEWDVSPLQVTWHFCQVKNVFHLSFPLKGVNIICRPVNQYQVINNKLHVVVITIAKCTLNSTELEVLVIVDQLSKLFKPFLMFPDSRQVCRESIFSLRRCAVWKVKLFCKRIGMLLLIKQRSPIQQSRTTVKLESYWLSTSIINNWSLTFHWFDVSI